MEQEWLAFVRGSSPQARGARGLVDHVPRGFRLIPAGAGSTHRTTQHAGDTRAHPRRRGEHSVATGLGLIRSGSSPQARGAQPHAPISDSYQRLIPAGAGSTRPRTEDRPARRAHPRRRGEHGARTPASCTRSGSSPQARGAHGWGVLGCSPARLIPAGAGSTPGVPGPSEPCTAHPRRRGEHGRRLTRADVEAGSSPQARGAPQRAPGRRASSGLIPAGAGSTLASCSCPPGGTAHPRRRGEHGSAYADRLWQRGSSPQARGAR